MDSAEAEQTQDSVPTHPQDSVPIQGEDIISSQPVDVVPTQQEKVFKRRGTTKQPKMQVREGRVVKLHVDFDDSGMPTGRQKDKFATFLGVKARSKVGILWPSWGKVPEEIKKMLWEDILVCNFYCSVFVSFFNSFTIL